MVRLYFYPNSVIEIARNVKPSYLGELEITCVNWAYVALNELKVQIMSPCFTWADTGTHESCGEALKIVKAFEKRTGLKIACLEEIAMNYKWIDKKTIFEEVKDLKGDYLKYLKKTTQKI